MARLAIEKRSNRRYSVGADFRFSWRQGELERVGWGKIRDLADHAVCFESGFTTPPGTELEIRIPWPETLQNGCGLELVARGSVIRSESERSVLRVREFEFRTCGERSFHQSPLWDRSCEAIG